MIISSIVAVARNNVIGDDIKIPWYLPNDLKYFKKRTLGHHILMGRNCFESLGKPLKNREHIVITRNPYYIANGVKVVHSINEGLQMAEDQGESECFIIGGGTIYEQTKHLWDKLYFTEVDLEPEGDVFFPKIDFKQWQLEWQEHHPKDERHICSYTFEVWNRRP